MATFITWTYIIGIVCPLSIASGWTLLHALHALIVVLGGNSDKHNRLCIVDWAGLARWMQHWLCELD